MVAWLTSPRGSTITATAVAVMLAAVWLVPRWIPVPSSPGAKAPAGLMSPGAASPGSAASKAGPQASAGVPGATQTGPAPADPAGHLAAKDATLGGATYGVAGAHPAAQNPAGTPPAAGGDAAVASLQGAAAGPASSAQKTDDPSQPSFDVVRVEPTGDALVAGRGLPDSDVALMDGAKVLTTAKSDQTGQFALLPPRLGEGDHFLTLRTTRAGQSSVTSQQGVMVSVSKSGAAKPLVALLTPDQPTRILSAGEGAGADAAAPAAGSVKAPAVFAPGGGPAGATTAGKSGPMVAIQSVEAAQGGQFTATGVAHAGSQCRLYLNGAFLADVTAGRDGRWSVKVGKGMRPGKYVVRADELEGVNGAVVNRAEVPFDYPASAALGHGKRLLLSRASPGSATGAPPKPAAPGTGAAPSEPAKSLVVADAAAPGAATDANAGLSAAVVPVLQTTKVMRGDSLWRISRKMLGHGIAYTEIYASNVTQIRDPSRIYPGQIFVVPHHAVN